MFARRIATRLLVGLALAGLVAVELAPASEGRGAARGSKRCLVPGYDKTINQLWRPDMAAAVSYAHSRAGDIAFAVRTDHTYHAYRANHVEWSASVLKAMLMVAYLDRPSVRNRPLDSYDNSLLYPMITRSDNTAASIVDTIVGDGGLDALASRVGMTHFLRGVADLGREPDHRR